VNGDEKKFNPIISMTTNTTMDNESFVVVATNTALPPPLNLGHWC
jgi:hypothetical protein